ncbi:hypothetical protein IP81_11440 [Novosphingobium sp. AAP83]|uniref:hypothetical protein n=1 Tax=Novosphingobium sp. AAP83 TaxID=1523425 RepID=UPI0006B93D18|nr:hypothetical protein [Novosphingobium sp. AAP83]KPF91319.1 hypothetical protein IP81_11440 [Novosphingobium sp. AAP83]
MNAPANIKDRLEQAETITPDQPQPLLRELPDGLPYPVDALGPLQGAVEAVQHMTQAPVAIPAQSALSIAALAVQGFANVENRFRSAKQTLTPIFCALRVRARCYGNGTCGAHRP